MRIELHAERMLLKLEQKVADKVDEEIMKELEKDDNENRN
jgi:hypothetical protein